MEDPTVRPWKHLETLQGTAFYRLYRSPSSALAIFRKRLSSLGVYVIAAVESGHTDRELAQSFVMTLLFVSRPLLQTDFDLLVKPGSASTRYHHLAPILWSPHDIFSEYRTAILILEQYHILKKSRVKQTNEYSLTPEFAKSLRQALTGEKGGDAFGEIIDVSPDERVSIGELNDFAKTQWENILGYIVGSSGAIPSAKQAPAPPPLIISLLQFGDLVALSGTEGHGSYPRITKAGFSFMLQAINSQLWTLLFLYMKSADQLGLDEISLLSFIFVVLSLELGSTFSISSLSETQQTTLRVLTALGIVYCPDDLDDTTTSVFHPTQLAGVLASDSGSVSRTMNSRSGIAPAPMGIEATRGFIIIETNFRLYAYTSSPLQIAILSLFVNLRSRHPNLVTGKVTPRSIKSALQRGISAQQIISYLSSHAHPQMRLNSIPRQEIRDGHSAVLPATVVDQIHLWELERDRMRTTSGFLLQNYASAEQYRAACRRAADLVVWRDDEKKMFFVNVETAEHLKMFLR